MQWIIATVIPSFQLQWDSGTITGTTKSVTVCGNFEKRFSEICDLKLSWQGCKQDYQPNVVSVRARYLFDKSKVTEAASQLDLLGQKYG